VRKTVVGTDSNTVAPVPEEQSSAATAADNQPPTSEASNSPMDVDSPTAGFLHFTDTHIGSNNHISKSEWSSETAFKRRIVSIRIEIG